MCASPKIYVYVFFIIIDKRGINLKWARRIHYIVCVFLERQVHGWMKNFVNYVLLCFLILWLARVHILLSCIYMLAEQLIWTIFAKFFLSLVSQFLHSATRVPFCFVKCVLVNSKKCNPHRRRQPTNQNLTNQLLKEKKTLRRSSVLLRNNFLRKWASGQKFHASSKLQPTPQL